MVGERRLASPPPKHKDKDNYLLTMKVEDITSEDSEGTSEKQGVDQVETSDKNVENEVEEQIENVEMQKLDFLTKEVEDMISKDEGEAECLEKVERLQMILKLLDEERKETKKRSGSDGGTDMVIRKLQTKKAEKPDSVKNVIGKGSTAIPIKTKPENVEINKDEVSGKGPGASTLVKEKPIRKLETEKPEQAEKPDSVKNVVGKGSTVTPIQTKPENVEINKDEVDEVSGKGPGASTSVKEKPICKLETEKPEQAEKLDSGGNAAGSSETPTKLQEECFTKDMENYSDAGEVKMKDICKTNENEVDKKEIESNVEMESGNDGDFISGEDSSTGKEDYGQEEEKSDGNQEVACKDEGEGKEEIRKMESSGDISKDEFDSVSDLVIDEEMLETVNLTEDTVESCDPQLDNEDENEDSFPPLSQNVHHP